MARVLIVVGHVRSGSYCEALGQSYAKGALAGGHEATLLVTSKMKFDPILWEGFERVQALEPDLQEAHDAMLAADHLVFIFPLWMGMVPAILKGFLERVLQPDMVGLAMDGNLPQILKGKSARFILTMGMPAFVYRWWFGAYALKTLKRCIFAPVGVRPIRSTILGNVEGAGLGRRMRWLKGVEILGQRAG